jgi:hypothetical protein
VAPAGPVHRLRGLEAVGGGAEQRGIVGHLGVLEQAPQADQVGRPRRQPEEGGAERRVQVRTPLRPPAERRQGRPDPTRIVSGEAVERPAQAVDVPRPGRPGDHAGQVRFIVRRAIRPGERRGQREAGEVADHASGRLGGDRRQDGTGLRTRRPGERPDQGVARPRRAEGPCKGDQVEGGRGHPQLADPPEQAVAVALGPALVQAGGEPRPQDGLPAVARQSGGGPGRRGDRLRAVDPAVAAVDLGDDDAVEHPGRRLGGQGLGRPGALAQGRAAPAVAGVDEVAFGRPEGLVLDQIDVVDLVGGGVP